MRSDPLVVKGVSEIAKFDTLRVNDSGDLVSPQGLSPGRVGPAGSVQTVGSFKATSLAGARLTYNGADVGKINAAGTHVVTLAGLPVLPGWLASLSKPKEGPATNATNITDTFKTGEGNGLVGAAHGDLEVFDVRLFINNFVVTNGATVEVSGGPLD